MPRRVSAVATALLLATAAGARAQTASTATSAAKTDAELLAMGRKVSEWLYGDQPDSIVSHMSKEGMEKAGGRAGVERMIAAVKETAGSEITVVEDRMTTHDAKPQYSRTGVFDRFSEEPVVLRWVFSPGGEVVGFYFQPKSQTPAAER